MLIMVFLADSPRTLTPATAAFLTTIVVGCLTTKRLRDRGRQTGGQAGEKIPKHEHSPFHRDVWKIAYFFSSW